MKVQCSYTGHLVIELAITTNITPKFLELWFNASVVSLLLKYRSKFYAIIPTIYNDIERKQSVPQMIARSIQNW